MLKKCFLPRLICCLLAAITVAIPLLSSLCSGEAAALDEQTNKVIRVGFAPQPGLSEIYEDGSLGGYTYDYLMEIAQFTGWKYEFITPEGHSTDEKLTKTMTMLENGEIDLIGSMRKTDALEEIFGYASYHYGISSVALLALADNAAIDSDNFYSKPNLRIAVLEGAKRQNAALERHCALNNILYTPVYASSEAGIRQLLKDNKADLMLWRDISPVSDTKIVTKFASETFFFATTKGNNDLVNELDAALFKIETLNPGFSADTYNKHFLPNKNDEVILSAQEKSYIEGLGELRVGLPPDCSPIQTFDYKTGEASGITVEILNLIAEKTGLRFKYESAASSQEFEKLVKSGALDIVSGMDYNYDLALSYGVTMTSAAISIPYVRIESTTKAVQNLSFAFPQRMTNLDFYDLEDNIKAIFYPTAIEAIKAVERGEVEAAYMESYVAHKIINDKNIKTMSILSVPREVVKICYGISESQDRQLATIISKVLTSIKEGTTSTIIYHNTAYTQQMNFGNIIALYPVESIVAVTFILLFIILSLTFNLNRTTRLKNQLAASNGRYLQLCELVGEVICKYDFSKDTLTISGANYQHFFCKKLHENFLTEHLDDDADDEDMTAESALAGLIQRLASGEANRRCLLPGGEKRWLCVNSQISANDSGPQCFICKIIDVDENFKEIETLTTKARTDSLTGLYNFGTCRKLVEEALKERGNGCAGVFMIMDIDNFKAINDSYGHFRGDQVLKAAAEILLHTFRDGDIVGRLGGDEFVAFSLGLTSREAIAQRCQEVLERVRSISEEIRVSISIGAVSFQQEVTIDTLYKLADRRLYMAKQAGRNGYDIGFVTGTDVK